MSKISPAKKFILTRKWLIILAIIIVLTVFGRIVDNKSLSQSAIVIGIGIDVSEDGFSVSAQSVSVTGSTAQGSPSQTFVTYTDKGKTLTDAFEKISQKMGLIVSLSHCNVVILSNSALLIDPVSLFSPLFKGLALPEQSVVLSAENVAAALSARLASTINSPFYIQAALLQQADNGGITRVTAKDYLANRLSRSGAVCVPMIKIIPMSEQPIASEQTADDNVQFDLSSGVATGQNKTLPLDDKQTQAVSIFLAQNPTDKLCATTPNGEYVEFRIIKKDGKVKADDYTVNADLEFELSFLEARLNNGDIADVDCTSPVVAGAASQLAEELESTLHQCLQYAKENNSDFLLLENKVYQSYGRTLPQNCLQEISLSLSVKMTATENS